MSATLTLYTLIAESGRGGPEQGALHEPDTMFRPQSLMHIAVLSRLRYHMIAHLERCWNRCVERKSRPQMRCGWADGNFKDHQMKKLPLTELINVSFRIVSHRRMFQCKRERIMKSYCRSTLMRKRFDMMRVTAPGSLGRTMHVAPTNPLSSSLG